MKDIEHHKRELKFLIVLLLIFLMTFIIALINLKKNVSIFGLDLPLMIENWIIFAMSFFGVLKVFFSLLRH
ncbi:MAG: hypothetical protein ABIC04_07940 [Nanoarchaeota archaeon]